uniref:Uncharacterized protein n=1 Tax=Glossina austeni TaxID=7395 RepID=A0A1A9UIT2_GLOAU
MKLKIVLKNTMKLRKSLNLYNEIGNCCEKHDEIEKKSEFVLTQSFEEGRIGRSTIGVGETAQKTWNMFENEH